MSISDHRVANCKLKEYIAPNLKIEKGLVMALITANFYSNALGTGTSATVILPDNKAAAPPYQVLYLMGGGFTDHTYMMREIPVERYVWDYNLAVVMPYMAGRYLYKNMPYGEQWWDYYSQELPEICEKMFNISKERKDTFVAGNSGGALCALKLGLQKPEKFSAVGAVFPPLLSQPFVNELRGNAPWRYEQIAHFYGDPMDPEYDIFNILKNASTKEQKADLYLCCGTEDALFEINTKFRDRATELGFNPNWYQGPGTHSADFFAEGFLKILDWLPLNRIQK